MYATLLTLLISMIASLAQGEVSTVGSQEIEKQCKEMIVQHFLTERVQFNPKIINCINFLRNEDRNTVNKININQNSSGNQLDLITTEKTSGDAVNERTTTNAGRGDHTENGLEIKQNKNQLSSETLLSEDSKPTTPKEDDLIDIYPENIVQEWPAVEMVRRKRSVLDPHNTYDFDFSDDSDAIFNVKNTQTVDRNTPEMTSK